MAAAALISLGFLYTLFTVSTVVREVSHPLPPDLAPEARPAARQPGERTNILVMGLDDDHRHADLVLLLSIDEGSRKVALLQIPRETRALIAGADAFAQLAGADDAGVVDQRFPGSLRVLKTVESLLDVPVHDTITVEPEGFRKLVDDVGGMQVNVPFAMDYDDPVQQLHIHLAAGPQKLHGEQVLEFVRWRHNNDGGGHPEGEAGRLRMQQELLQALLDQLVSPRNLPRLPSLVMAVAAHVHATMAPARLISLVLAVASRADLTVATLPGIDASLPQPDQQGRRSYYLPDPDGTARLVDRLIRGIDPGAAASIRVEVAVPDDHDKAARITARLAAQGFAVSTIAPPAAMPAATQVIDLRGDAARAQLVAGSLVSQGLAVELLSQPDSKATADVRVIFGSDVRSTFNGS